VTKQGKRAVTVCSTAFKTLGRAQARALGNSNLPIAVIPHPFGGRSREDVRKIAEQCVVDIAKLLSGEKP
jgi:predicted dienelactone hydrolase